MKNQTKQLKGVATKLEHTQAMLHVSEEKYRRLVENELRLSVAIVKKTPGPTTVQDFKGNIISWNHGAEDVYGYSEKEAIEAGFRDVVVKIHQFRETKNEQNGDQLRKYQLIQRSKQSILSAVRKYDGSIGRGKEGLITYVWFGCVKADCDGQWWQWYLGLRSRQFVQSVG